MDLDVPIDSLATSDAASCTGKGKRKASLIDLTDDSRASKSRTLGGDLPGGSVVVREIMAGTIGDSSRSHFWGEPPVNILPQPPLLTYLSANVEGTDDILEARNSENSGKLFLYSTLMQECNHVYL